MTHDDIHLDGQNWHRRCARTNVAIS